MNEDRASKLVWWVAAGVVAGLIAWRFLPEVENPFAPEPVAAHVAVIAEGRTVASDGWHELAAGRPFRLHAVLEARDWRGREIWYSEAPALRVGTRDLPAEAIRRWPSERIARVRWFTVEGFAPYLEVATDADLARLGLVDEFRPEWGTGWVVDGRVDPRAVPLAAGSPLRPLTFGTQRYAVRIELFDSAEALTPSARWSSPAAEQMTAEPGSGTAVVARLPSPLATLSAHVGRTQLAPATGLAPALLGEIAERHERGLGFTAHRLWLEHLAESGRVASGLAWETVALGAGRLAWGVDVAPGDLLQAGERIVVLYRDQGAADRLDPADLVFDAARGLRIARLDEVFLGEDGLEVEWARLSRSPDR